MPEKSSVKRLEALKERQLVNERRIKKDIEDSKKELKQLENDSDKMLAVADTQMEKLTENLQRSLENRSLLEAKVAELQPEQRGHALRRREAEERSWSLLRDTQLIEEEFCELQKLLKAKCEEKERRFQQLQLQREELRRLAEEASRFASEAASIEAEATQLDLKRKDEVRKELAFDRASLVRRTALQQRMFVALAAYVGERRREEQEWQRRLRSWFSTKGPALLQAWHRRTVQLRSKREELDAAAAMRARQVFTTWAEFLEEERFWRRFVHRVSSWRRGHLLRWAHALWRCGVRQTKREAHWPHHRLLLSKILQTWHEVTASQLALGQRLAWSAQLWAIQALPRAWRGWCRCSWEIQRRAARLTQHATSQKRKAFLRSWRHLWLCQSRRGPLRSLGRRCIKRAFAALQRNVLLLYMARKRNRRRLQCAFEALRPHRKIQDKPVPSFRPRRILAVWVWWRFLAKQSVQLKVQREKWKRLLLRKRLRHWRRCAQIRSKAKRDAWTKFSKACCYSRRRRLLKEASQLRREKRLLHHSFMALLSCWQRAARHKRQSMHRAQEECEALARGLQLAEGQCQEIQERRLSEETAMEELMTEKRLLELFHHHMHHEFACHQKSQQKCEAVAASQILELEKELCVTCSSQSTLESLLRNEEQRAETFHTEDREMTQAVAFRSQLREIRVAAEAKLKEKEEEVCSLRQSVLRNSCSQSQLRVKIAGS